MKFVEHVLEVVMFRSRWFLAPMYIGLVGGLLLMLVKFVQEFVHIFEHIVDTPEKEVVLSILGLVDITLVANLLIMVIFSGYENFVSKISVAKDTEDRPSWMGKVDFSGLKIKLIGSLVAISVIQLLAVFLEPEMTDTDQIFWMIMIHLTFVVSGVLFAVMDYIADKRATLDIAAEKAALELRIMEKEHGFREGYAEALNPQQE